MGRKQQSGDYLQEDKGGKEGSGQAGKSPVTNKWNPVLVPKGHCCGRSGAHLCYRKDWAVQSALRGGFREMNRKE